MIELPRVVLANTLRACLQIASKDSTRPHVYGLHFERLNQGALQVCATDGWRVGIFVTIYAGENGFPAKGVMIDRDAAELAYKAVKPKNKSQWDDTTTLKVVDNQLVVNVYLTDTLVLRVSERLNLVDQKQFEFPDVRRAIPAMPRHDRDEWVAVDPRLMEKISKATVYLYGRYRQVLLNISHGEELDPIMFTTQAGVPDATGPRVFMEQVLAPCKR